MEQKVQRRTPKGKDRESASFKTAKSRLKDSRRTDRMTDRRIDTPRKVARRRYMLRGKTDAVEK